MSQFSPVRMNCDAIAPYYEFLEHLSFGSCLERSRFAFLGETRTAQRAIVCGGGDGRFLARLLRANPRLQADFVDLSPRMAELAERRIRSMGGSFRARVRFHTVDLRDFQPPPGGYDLIVTNFFLDCFSDSEIADVVACLSAWGAPKARWTVSDFREGGSRTGRTWTRAVIRALYAAFEVWTRLHVVRLPNYVAALARGGFQLRCEENSLGGLVHASLWEKD